MHWIYAGYIATVPALGPKRLQEVYSLVSSVLATFLVSPLYALTARRSVGVNG